MDNRQDGKYRPSNQSRVNKRIQLLEEHVANLNRELKRIGEVVGSKADTNELFSFVNQMVVVRDVTGREIRGTLDKIGKWTITISRNNTPAIFFKGNLISVVPTVK